METGTIDKLYLELSQFTKAKTNREIRLENRIKELEVSYSISLGRIKELEDAIRAALKIKTCWLPGPEENINQENIGECQALMDMCKTFQRLVENEEICED